MTMAAWAICAACVALTPSERVLSVSARLKADSIEPGARYEITLETSLAQGVSGSAAGMPAPLLQLDVPDCVRLEGEPVSTYEKLAKNEFLHEPFERLIEDSSIKIGFRLLEKPRPADRIYLNVIAYVHASDHDFFVRRRLSLPLELNAVAEPVSPEDSGWGTERTLEIGDKAPDFTLPRGDGSMVSLSAYSGKKNVIVTTYRAHW